jgi:hypothetical protein
MVHLSLLAFLTFTMAHSSGFAFDILKSPIAFDILKSPIAFDILKSPIAFDILKSPSARRTYDKPSTPQLSDKTNFLGTFRSAIEQILQESIAGDWVIVRSWNLYTDATPISLAMMYRGASLRYENWSWRLVPMRY